MMTGILPLVFSLLAFGTALIAAPQPQYRAISIEHVWQGEVPVKLFVDTGTGEEAFTLSADAAIIGPAKDVTDSAQTLSDLKALIAQANCRSGNAPRGVISFTRE